MNKLHILIFLLNAVVFNDLRATEPPEIVSIKEKVRMSTLIIVGRVVQSCVFDTKSSRVVKDKRQIGPHESGSLQIKIERVLYSSRHEMPIYSQTSHPQNVEVVFGSPGLDIGIPEDIPKIFFLTSDADRTAAARPYHYPFYDWTNLSVPITDEAAVKRVIAVFDAAK